MKLLSGIFASNVSYKDRDSFDIFKTSRIIQENTGQSKERHRTTLFNGIPSTAFMYLRSEDGLTADTAGMGGRVVGMRRKNVESDISSENIQ